MKDYIFYSWQSDLPNNTNRSFLMDCINDALQTTKNITPFSIELALDRDTKDETGTPDILDTIFFKIQRAKMFLADISIINSDYLGRKTPNPNVLIELGYAARVLGWDKIICLYNLDYGTINDLPFDLRQRRPLTYSLKDKNRKSILNIISKVISDTIIKLHGSGRLFNVIDDYIKEKVDTEILTLSNHLCKIIFGYTDKTILERTGIFLDMQDDQIIEHLKKNEFIGFQIFKKFKIHEEKLRNIADNAISSIHHNKEMAIPIIELISWIGRFDCLNSTRNDPGFFKATGRKQSQYIATQGQHSNNDNLHNRLLLLKKLPNSEYIVTDFGDFYEKDKINKLTDTFAYNESHNDLYIPLFRQFINVVTKWLELTNGTFIIDTFHNFELKFSDIKK